MPLLICPNDQTPMTEVERHGVHLDMCPQCRGVWLDRGELEKMLELSGGRPAQGERERAYREDDYRQDSYDRPRKKKKRDLFDFFDF